MVLVDTSVWVSHLRGGNPQLEELLVDGDVICHPFIIGELACGNIKNRTEILSLLHSLPMGETIEQKEILHFIERNRLMGKGVGLIDVHLIASAILSDVLLWSEDKRLKLVSAGLNIIYEPQ